MFKKSNNQANKLYRQIADAENSTVDEVIREMELAIDEFWNTKPINSELAFYHNIFGGKKPSVEQFILVCAIQSHPLFFK